MRNFATITREGEWENTPLLLRLIGFSAHRRRVYAPLIDGGMFDRWQYESEAELEAAADEYHLIDLANGQSLGGYISLAGAREVARMRGLRAWQIYHGNARVEHHDPDAIEKGRS